MVELLLDILFGITLLSLAAGALFCRDLFANVALFIVFGLVLSLVWAYLNAVDLALAEAAIGAGLTGVLLLSAAVKGESEKVRRNLPRRWWVMGAALIAVLAGIFSMAISGVSEETMASASRLAYRNLEHSGVSHPVTAVLVNFRAWDTLLELGVLLLALLGIKHIRPLHTVPSSHPWPSLEAWTTSLSPLLVLTSGYLLWRGAHGPGGAFQAGALLAAGLIILRLNRLLPPLDWSAWPVRGLVLISLVLFLTVATGTHWLGAGWLSYGFQHSKWLIVLIESAATISIGAALTLMVVGEEREFKV
jgi:multisubunit Na+/H+ antiporter MnhB subunit